MQRISDLEKQYVLEVLDAQFRTSAGSMMTKRLEQLFAEKFDSEFAISFINGTATMHAALAAAGIGAGDEVIVPPLTMASTCIAVLQAGATPIFADIDPDTWTLDPKSIAERISPQTKAIIPVAIYGQPPDMDGIMDLAAQHNLFVLEDDAECFLGYYKGRVLGSIGHAASFSFQSSKHITAGEGGMITTNDETLANEIRRFNSLGYAGVGAGAGKGKITKDTIQDPNYARHVSLGWNYRMPELCSAVALAQLERLSDFVALRQQIAAMFAQAVGNCPWLIPQAVPAGTVNAYWTFVARLQPQSEFTWYDFRRKYMELGGDGVYAAWKLNYLEPLFQSNPHLPPSRQVYAEGLCPVAERIQPTLLQFKTNYMDAAVAEQKVEALYQAVQHFGG